MLSQRILQQSMRQLAQTRSHSALVSQRIAPSVNAAVLSQRRLTGPKTSVRTASSATDPKEETSDILIKQRMYRPVSPHLGIYRPQITWLGSGLNRITAVILSGGFYLFGGLYLLAPAFGWQLTSAAMAASFAKWPVALKLASKLFVVVPFTYHCLNGFRHFLWDLGLSMTNKAVIQTGWTVVGLTAVSSIALLFA